MNGFDWHKFAHTYITEEKILNLFWAVLILMIGVALSRRVDSLMNRFKHLDVAQRMMFTKFARYAVVTLAISMALAQLGFDLRVLLGAAGILTVAIGFASQTSASNLISGIFLMVEKPFVIGDVVDVAGTRGEVLAIDLLSCKVRTPNNMLVRIPNETMVKSNIINVSYFPIRRFDIQVGVGYASDLRRVRDLLFEAAHSHPQCLTEPAPEFTFSSFGDSAMNVVFQVWTLRENTSKVQTDLYIAVKEQFDKAGIDIPFPIRTLQIEGALPALKS